MKEPRKGLKMSMGFAGDAQGTHLGFPALWSFGALILMHGSRVEPAL